jgi:hypothetical protein
MEQERCALIKVCFQLLAKSWIYAQDSLREHCIADICTKVQHILTSTSSSGDQSASISKCRLLAFNVFAAYIAWIDISLVANDTVMLFLHFFLIFFKFR